MDTRPANPEGWIDGGEGRQMMLDSAWGEVGIPSIITCDQGSQFVSQWWNTICSRLGVRMAFSQSHRPQANGRAEVAGRVLQDVLRKVLITLDINWVEALPRALRIIHDTPDPLTGLSPYQVVFGRERALAGLPWTPERKCEDAELFFERMRWVDCAVADRLNEAHRAVQEKLNARRHERPNYAPEDWVWYRRPTGVGGLKLQTCWQGPFRVIERVGERSYRLRTPQGEKFDVHADQLKPCVWDDPSEGGLDLQYPQREAPENGEGGASH
jgi:hypothetical protein